MEEEEDQLPRWQMRLCKHQPITGLAILSLDIQPTFFQAVRVIHGIFKEISLNFYVSYIHTERMAYTHYECGFALVLSPGPYGAPSMNVGILDGRNILGYNGHVCKKCLSWVIAEIHDYENRLFKPNHTCDPQKLYNARSVTDIPETIQKK